MERLDRIWYGGEPVPLWLSLLEGCYRAALGVRRALYRAGLLGSARLSVPVVVVGNITAGGTGKTPLTIWLAHELEAHGWRPGVILRGYGGSDMSPAMLHLADDPRVEAVIVLTDGDIAYPPAAMPYDVLWVLPPGATSSFQPPYGAVIQMQRP